MRIQTTEGKDFQLPAGFAAEYNLYNVLLCDAGEQTAPLTLPGIPENLELVGWSNRIDNEYKPFTDLKVLVSDGLMARWCNMGIHSATRKEGISCTLYFAIAEFYSRAGTRKLASLAWPTYMSPTYTSQTLTQRVQYLINLLKAQYSSPTDSAIFGVRPVATTKECTWKFSKHVRTGEVGTYVVENVKGLLILNGFEKWQSSIDFKSEETKNLTVFEGEFPQIQIENDVDIPLTLGYGMTPFLKLRYVLEFIFSSFGYTVDMSRVTDITDYYQHRIFLLNNVADAIYGGKLEVKQLVPDVTIKEFIAEIEKLFVGKFIIDEISRKATFYVYGYQLNEFTAMADMDLTEYLVTEPELGATEFVTLKLINSRDSTTDTSDTGDNTSSITFDFLSTVKVADTYLGVNGSIYGYVNVNLDMLQIDGVTHRNSTVVVDGKPLTEKAELSSMIQLMQVKTDNGSHNCAVTLFDKTSTLYYKTGIPLFQHAGYASPFKYIENRYWRYQQFLSKSNIPIEVDMRIPDHIIENLKLGSAKIISGQKVMIESIRYVKGSDLPQQVKFRTIRVYLYR